jgi:hypothetical protein
MNNNQQYFTMNTLISNDLPCLVILTIIKSAVSSLVTSDTFKGE